MAQLINTADCLIICGTFLLAVGGLAAGEIIRLRRHNRRSK